LSANDAQGFDVELTRVVLFQEEFFDGFDVENHLFEIWPFHFLEVKILRVAPRRLVLEALPVTAKVRANDCIALRLQMPGHHVEIAAVPLPAMQHDDRNGFFLQLAGVVEAQRLGRQQRQILARRDERAA